MFGDLFNTPPRKVVEKQPPTTIPYELELYRGFEANIDDIHRQDDKLILSPAKSEQGLLWFTHKLISVYDPKDYVKGRGNYLLTSPLKCVKHIQRKIYADGSHYDTIPPEILDMTDPTSNSRFHMGVEVPEGWVFSYKTEKFIGCSIDLAVTTDMISKQ